MKIKKKDNMISFVNWIKEEKQSLVTGLDLKPKYCEKKQTLLSYQTRPKKP